jgi:chromosome segregation ATPase
MSNGQFDPTDVSIGRSGYRRHQALEEVAFDATKNLVGDALLATENADLKRQLEGLKASLGSATAERDELRKTVREQEQRIGQLQTQHGLDTKHCRGITEQLGLAKESLKQVNSENANLRRDKHDLLEKVVVRDTIIAKAITALRGRFGRWLGGGKALAQLEGLAKNEAAKKSKPAGK